MTDRSVARTLWNARQCADHVGISQSTWRKYAADPRGTGAPVPVTPAHATAMLWDAATVRDFAVRRRAAQQQGAEDKAARDAARQSRAENKPSPRTRGQQDGSLWTATQCALHHGVRLGGWKLAVRRGLAPQPVDTSRPTVPLWSADAVRAVTCFPKTPTPPEGD